MNTYAVAYDRPLDEAEQLHQAHRYTGRFLRDGAKPVQGDCVDTDDVDYVGWSEWLLSTDREGRQWFRNVRTGACQAEPPNKALAHVSGHTWPPDPSYDKAEAETEAIRSRRLVTATARPSVPT